MPSGMGDISDLELPMMLLENDGNLEKAETCRKELEDVSKSVKCFTIKELSDILLSLCGML
jgi:hypothetical protein